MGTTIVRDEQQTTIPADVSEAAGLKPGDHVEWRFEDGEIRGRKIATKPERRIVGKLVQKGDALVLEGQGVEIDPDAIADAVREERDQG